MTRWRQFVALTWRERRTLLAATVGLPLFGIGLRVLGMRRLQACLRSRAPASDDRLSRDECLRIAALIDIASRYGPYRATCLTRSLLLGWMLERRGVASRLRIGVRLIEGAFQAHAWIECARVPVNDRPDVGERYAPFAEILPPGAFQSS